MAHRYWEATEVASQYAKYRPVSPDGLINRVIGFLKEKYTGPLNMAYDVGCGSGQCTKLFAPHFTNMVGTDVSPAQIDQAIKNNNLSNVTFKVSPAEIISEPDGSVQLISASQAAHWFDLPKFYAEGKRVLSPGGVMCLTGYELPTFVWSKDPSKEAPLRAALMDVYENDLRGCWNEAGMEMVNTRYAPYVIPYSDFTRDESFYQDMEISVEDMVMSISTWSGFAKFCEQKGGDEGLKILNKYRSAIMEILKEPTSSKETMVIMRISFFLLMARK